MQKESSLDLDLKLTYPGFDLELALCLPGRGVSALFGASGSGKTTLLRIVAGLEKGAQGRVQVGDAVWQDTARGVFVPTHRRSLGMVFQDAALFPHLSVRQNLRYGVRRSGGSSALQEPLIELLGIGHLLERRPDTLSGGEQQRVAIARALLPGPRLLLMDEPLAALDEARKAEFLPWLEKLHDELAIPVLYVSHALSEVARLADHLVLMQGGRALAAGDLASVLPRLDLPLARDEESSVVILATTDGYDAQFSLASLTFNGQRLLVPSPPRPSGVRVRLRIQARDVSLALTPAHDSSILNLLPARVVAIELQTHGRAIVRLDVAGAAILARLTQKSLAQLGIGVGAAVYAQIKSVALLD